MITSFKNRSPFATLLIGLLFGPVLGFLYLNRGITAFVYLVISILSAMVAFVLVQNDVIELRAMEAINLFVFTVQGIGALHGSYVAKRKQLPLPLKFYARWYGILSIAIIGGIVLILFRTYCFEPFAISGSSMRPNLKEGDMVFSNKFIYRLLPIARGDIVTLKLPSNIIYAKRVIGLPHDTVQLKNGIVYINNQKIDKVAGHASTRFIETLPEGQTIEIQDDLKNGRYDNTKKFTVPADHYFVLGDNRDHSEDSRASKEVGFVPAEHITGRVTQPFKSLKTN